MSKRAVDLIEKLESHLLQFIRDNAVTPDEYRTATKLMIDSVKAGEESLLLDVFFEAEATDVVNQDRKSSITAIEGPFYFPGAPLLERPYVMPQREFERGERLTFKGTVKDIDGRPLEGAELDMWHADAEGLYSNIHPGIPDWNLRGRFHSDSEGVFEVTTILPPPYEIPKAGPTGQVLQLLGRHFFRPAHLHVKVSADGCEDLTSQLYFDGDEYLDSDVANAVRDGLVLTLESDDSGHVARYDFVLDLSRQSHLTGG